MQETMLPEIAWGCGETVIALLLMVVGGVSVRPVEPRAGYLVLGAGFLVFLRGCCGTLPNVMLQAGVGYGALEVLFAVDTWVGLLLTIGTGVASIAAAAMLARAVLATPAAGGGAR